jgi:hypothetical protein
MVRLTYECWFNFGRQQRKVSSDRGITAFCNGFWISGKGELTTWSHDCEPIYWIPPSAIIYIHRIKKEE